MDSIFAGKLSLTDDIPEQPATRTQERVHVGTKPWYSAGTAWQQPVAPVIDAVKWDFGYIKDISGQPQPIPEPGLSPAAQRVRAEARRLGIDYDGEVARVLHRMLGRSLDVAPGPFSKKAGPDPLADVSPENRRLAETTATEIIRRKHGIEITWEE